MALQTSGPISLDDLQDEFGGSNPIRINEYYRGGVYVPSTGSTIEGPEYSLASPIYGWAAQVGEPYQVLLYWNDALVYFFFDVPPLSSNAITSYNGYSRGSYRSTQSFEGSNYYVFQISRSTSVNINTNVPSSGTISLDDFYGATAT